MKIQTEFMPVYADGFQGDRNHRIFPAEGNKISEGPVSASEPGVRFAGGKCQ